MRAREILQEDYNASLKSDLDNLLTAAAGNGATDVSTIDVANQLQAMGYSVNQNSIISLLSTSPIVLNATPDQITLKSPDGAEASASDTEDSADRVSDMAMNATNIG